MRNNEKKQLKKKENTKDKINKLNVPERLYKNIRDRKNPNSTATSFFKIEKKNNLNRNKSTNPRKRPLTINENKTKNNKAINNNLEHKETSDYIIIIRN